MLRNVHESVLPPVPLPVSAPVVMPSVNGPAQQQHWLSTIALMEQQPNADLTELQSIREHITLGVSLPFTSIPSAITYTNTPAVRQHADAVRGRLAEYIAFNAATPLPPDHDLEGQGIQPLHVIIKDDKKPRVAIDLSRNLNSFLKYVYFQYSNVDDAVAASYPGCWYGKLDLSNCFLSFPLHPSVRRYFHFCFEGTLYQFTSMPFGLSTAPYVCTLLLSVLSFALTNLGISHIIYLDDILMIGKTRSLVQEQLALAQVEIARFGLIVNTTKTEGPSQVITFLGITLNSLATSLSCPPTRISELTTLLHSLRHQQIITRKHCESLIGKLSFAALVLPGARPFMRRMLDTVNACTTKRRSAPVRIDPGFREDVRFWLLHLSDWNGTQLWRSSRASPYCFASDASLNGFGFYLESTPTPEPGTVIDSSAWPHSYQLGATFSGTYSTKHAQYHQSHTHIAWCELMAVVAAAATYAPLLKNQSLLFFVDNSTDVHIINRQSTRSKQLAGLLRELYSIALKHNINIRAQHRPGAENVLADFLSRPELHQHNHVQQWKKAHPILASRLSSVSLICSSQFVSSSTSTAALPCAPIPKGHTTHTIEPIAGSARPLVSTLNTASLRGTCVQLSSSMLTRTKSPHCQDSSLRSKTTHSLSIIPTSPAIDSMTVCEQDLITGMVVPTSLNLDKVSPLRTYAISAANSICRPFQTHETGVPVCSLSTASLGFTNIPAAICA